MMDFKPSSILVRTLTIWSINSHIFDNTNLKKTEHLQSTRRNKGVTCAALSKDGWREGGRDRGPLAHFDFSVPSLLNHNLEMSL